MQKFLRADAVLCLVVAALSAWAIARHPYGYYTLVRWVVCAMGAYMAWRLYESKMTGLAVLFGGIALLFNPIFRVHLDRATWEPLNLACAVAFVGAAYLTSRLKQL